MKFENFQEAYLHNMKNVYLTPEFINEPRGNKSKEVLNLSFVIENPIERVCYLPSRKTNIVFFSGIGRTKIYPAASSL